MLFVLESEITKRHIAQNHIKAAVLKLVFLKAVNGNLRSRIQLLSDTPRKTVNFHTIKVRIFACFLVHTPEEIADTTGRL